MFKHTPTGLYFRNRKQAIILMGHKRYNAALKNKEFVFSENREDSDYPDDPEEQ